MMIRIAELEINIEYLDEYIALLKEESEASVRLETGTICIYPMFKKEHSTKINILEIYTHQEAYKEHLHPPTSKNTKQVHSLW
jgi:quinol monooxygenase YgiN